MKKLLSLAFMLIFLALPPVCTAGAEDATTLRIAGFISEYELAGFMRETPDIRVESVTNDGDYMYDAGSLIQALTTGDATYDVLVTNTETLNLPSVLEKGFAAPLDTPALQAAYEAMYPFVQEAVSFGGVCYGVPLYLFSGSLSYDPAAFRAAGLPVPTGWEELADLINGFPEQPEEVRETYELFLWATNYRAMYFQLMTEAYVTHMQAAGQELRFDTPLYRSLMARAEGLTRENDTEDERDAIALMQNVDVLQNGYGEMGLLLPLAMDGRTSIGVSAFVAIINPYSEHIPEALRLLEYIVAHYEPAVRLTLLQEGNAPVAYEDYGQRIAEWEAEKARLEQALLDGDPADARENQEALDRHLAGLEGIERWHHWRLAEETIEAWQAVAPYIVITRESVLQYRDASGEYPASVLMRRYRAGELPLEHFIRQMDEKCRMMILERQ